MTDVRPITEAEMSKHLAELVRKMPPGRSPIIDVVKRAPPRATVHAPYDVPEPLPSPRKPDGRDWLDIGSPKRTEPSMAQIMAAVSDVTGIPTNEFRSPRRNRPVAHSRQLFFYLCKKFTSRSLPQIGHYAGKKDHSTVMHGIRRVMQKPEEYQPQLNELVAAFTRLEAKRKAEDPQP